MASSNVEKPSGEPETTLQGHGEGLSALESFSTKADDDIQQLDVRLDPEVVEKLSYGLRTQYLPQMQKAKSSLEELTENQRILIETVQQENAKFDECSAMTEVEKTMEQAKFYHTKLINIKKEMTMLHEKSSKLKKRALRIQQQKQKEELQKAQEHDRQLDRERELVARPAHKKKK